MVRSLVRALQRSSFQWLLRYLSPQVDLFSPPDTLVFPLLMSVLSFIPKRQSLTPCRRTGTGGRQSTFSPLSSCRWKLWRSHAAKSSWLPFLPSNPWWLELPIPSVPQSLRSLVAEWLINPRVCRVCNKVTFLLFTPFFSKQAFEVAFPVMLPDSYTCKGLVF